MTFFPGMVREVVGVVGDVRSDGLDQTRPTATLYMPIGQLSAPTPGGWHSFPLTLAVRANSPAALTSAVSNAVHEVDREVPLRDVFTMDDVVRSSVSQQRLNMLLLGAFGGIALLLATVGIYSVLAYNVRRQIQEIGIRMALGAGIRDVLAMVILAGMKPTLLGVAIGIVGALALGRVVSSLVFGVRTTDPVTFVVVAMLLPVVAMLASLVPAYRATKVDPVAALRYE
jgi:putative ABC transport system permease protein